MTLVKNSIDSRAQLTQGTGSAYWDLVFWVARNTSEVAFETYAYSKYGEYASALMADHALAPKINLQPILDRFGSDVQVQCEALGCALVCASRAYAKFSSLYPKNKEWVLKYRDVQFEHEAPGGVELMTGAIAIVEEVAA